MLKNYFFVFNLFLMALFHTVLANAARYEMTAYQINPDGPTQTAICDDVNETCYMTLTFAPKTGFEHAKDTYLDIAIRPQNKALNFHFMWNRNRLFTRGGKNKAQGYHWPVSNNKQTQKLTLYAPHPLESQDPTGALILRPSQEIIELKITIAPQ